MDIQQFLTLFINLVVLNSLIFLVVDFSSYLLNSWQKLSPSSTQPSHYQQVKDLLCDDPLLVTA